MSMFSPCTISAPGKALIAGGYLILEAENIGLVIAASARFYSTVAMDNNISGLIQPHVSINVHSIQFHKVFRFSFDFATEDLRCVSDEKNEFIEKCLEIVLLFVKAVQGEDNYNRSMETISTTGPLQIYLKADNDFYSQIDYLSDQSLPLLSSSLHLLERFRPCPVLPSGKVKVSKTGMGSSAALTTSLVAALLHFFGLVKLDKQKSDEDDRVIHNLAQLVHCIGIFFVLSNLYLNNKCLDFSARKNREWFRHCCCCIWKCRLQPI
jgi:phosphomevalonate kinase